MDAVLKEWVGDCNEIKKKDIQIRKVVRNVHKANVIKCNSRVVE